MFVKSSLYREKGITEPMQDCLHKSQSKHVRQNL